MSDFDTSQPAREKAGAKVVGWLLLGLTVIFGGAYVFAYFAAGDRIPRGTTVAGVQVGGMTQTEATSALRDGLADRETAPIQVNVGGETQELTPEDLGLSLDYEASVADVAHGRSWNPQVILSYFTGGEDREPVVATDDDTFNAAIASFSEQVSEKPVDGSITFRPGGFKVKDPKPGQGIDAEVAREALREAFLTGGTADLEFAEVDPEIDQAAIDQAVADFANPAMSAPVTFQFGESQVRLAPREYARALSLEPENGVLVPKLDSRLLRDRLKSLVAEAGEPVDASVRLVNGKPKVVPGKPGVTFDNAVVNEAFLDLVTKPDAERSMEVPSKVDEPAFSTADAKKLKIKERVSTFTTYFPYAEYRNINIGRAAEIVNGTVVKPGETFSLNDTVGERTAENGFTEGFIISNGIFKEDLGGGVSQMATTTFNAAFFAGMTDIEHKPHSFYIDRYPVGREATVAWPTVDLRFRNDTPYGVLISANLSPASASSQGALTVSVYSTKYWDITTKTGQRYNFTSPATRVLNTADCYPNSGYGGFDIDIWRYWRRAGSDELERTEKMHTTYTPSDTVVCEPPEPAPQPTPSPAN